MKLIPFWWKIVGALAIAALLAGAGWKINQWRHRAADADTAEQALADFKAATESRDALALAQQLADQARATQLATDLSTLRTAYADLTQAVRTVPITQTREATDETGRTVVTTTRSRAYRVCRNAAWTRDPAELAACQAYGSDAAGGQPVPATGLVRQREP